MKRDIRVDALIMLEALRYAQEAMFWHHAEKFEMEGMVVSEYVAKAIAIGEEHFAEELTP
jgi:hypothetical protein